MLGSVGILAVIWMFEWVMKKCDLECVWKQRCIEAFRFCSSPRGSGVLDEAFRFVRPPGKFTENFTFRVMRAMKKNVIYT